MPPLWLKKLQVVQRENTKKINKLGNSENNLENEQNIFLEIPGLMKAASRLEKV